MAKKFKKLKNPFPALFLAITDEIGGEREKKILYPNTVHTRPGQENSEKNRKKIKKLKNHFPALFLAKTGLDRPRKREKKFSPKFCSYPTRARKLQKKIAKKFKNLKNIILALFLAKTG